MSDFVCKRLPKELPKSVVTEVLKDIPLRIGGLELAIVYERLLKALPAEVPLTDDQIESVLNKCYNLYGEVGGTALFVRELEAEHGIFKENGDEL